MKKIKMLTVVPSNLATELTRERRIADYNTLPQLNDVTLGMIREYMAQRIGYSNLPMACLSSLRGREGEINGEEIMSHLPANSHNSVIFQLEMPEDMVVSIDFSVLLEISNDVGEIDGDEIEMEFLKERLFESMILGIDGGLQDPISFIPFLDFARCRFYAKFDSNFGTESLDLPGLTKINIRELSSFVN